MRAATILSFFLSIVLIATDGIRAEPTTQPLHVATRVATTQAATDLDGHEVSPLQLTEGHRAVVLIFISSDCPISNGYAPLIGELGRTFAPHGIDFFTVYSNAAETMATARAHHHQYGFPCDGLLDPAQRLASVAGATRTPEAVVVGPEGLLLYRGRIDDQYVVIGRKRFAATTHDLRDVLEAIVSGRPIDPTWMPAVGCEIN